VENGRIMSVSGKIWRGTAFVTGANILARVGTFLGNLAIIRLLGLDLVGELGLIEGWLNVALIVSLFGLNTATTKHVSHYLESDPDQIGGIATTALVLGGISSLGVGAFVFVLLGVPRVSEWALGSDAVAGPTVGVLRQYASILGCLIVLFATRQLLTGLFYGLQNFQVFVWVNVVIGAIAFPVSCLLVRWQGLLGALEVRGVLVLVEILLLAYAARRALRRMGVRLSVGAFGLNSRRLVSFGLPTFVGQLVANPVQPLMLSFLAAQPGGVVQVGLLTTAQRLSSMASFVPGSMAATVMPVLSTELGRGNTGRFRDSILVALRVLWLSTLPAVLVLMAASPTLLGMLYGGEYVAAWPVTLLLLMTALLVGLNESADRALAAANRMWLSTANNLLWVLLFIPMALALIPHGKAMGYALALLLSFSLYVLVQLGWLRCLYRVALASLVPLLALSAMLVAITWAISSRLAGLPQIVGAVALALLTLILQWRLFLHNDEKQALRRQMRQFWARGRKLVRRIAGTGDSDIGDHGFDRL
jgi:O-antigen/teichoic acid export membrane protein